MRSFIILLFSLSVFCRTAFGDPFKDAIAARGHGDTTRAIEILKPLAETGDSRAETMLGHYYEGKGINQNYSEAIKWYQKAAAQGEKVAQFNLGLLYLNLADGEVSLIILKDGEVPKDETEGLRWLLMSANQWYVPAVEGLAEIYSKGLGLKQDYEEAYFWRRISP
jgi:TPR repeat protein